MKYTPNYGLKKPEQDDFYNVEDFNENADIIDEKLKELENGIENIEVPVASVNNKTGDVVLTAEDVGAETPTGAQAKADAAEEAAKEYADNIVTQTLNPHLQDTMPHLFVDSVTGKTYKYGLSLENGVVMFNYEEVV